MSNMASNHSTALGIPQPHFTSCITAHQHIPHAPHHSTSHHHISHHIWHCMTSHLASHHIAHILHCTLLHITATLGWIRHNIPHLALQNIPHHTKFHTTLFHIMPCDVWSGGIELNMWNWCGMVWNIVELWWWDVVECITHRTSSHHFTSNTISDIIPNTTPFHLTPSFLTISHISYHTSTSSPLCNTIFQIAPYRPHYASHHISHCTPFHIMFHITPHSMYTTPLFRSHHILATL